MARQVASAVYPLRGVNGTLATDPVAAITRSRGRTGFVPVRAPTSSPLPNSVRITGSKPAGRVTRIQVGRAAVAARSERHSPPSTTRQLASIVYHREGLKPGRPLDERGRRHTASPAISGYICTAP